MVAITSGVTALAFSHRGDLLAVGFADDKVSLYKIDTGEEYLDVSVPTLFDNTLVAAIVFAEDDKSFNVVTTDGLSKRFVLR